MYSAIPSTTLLPHTPLRSQVFDWLCRLNDEEAEDANRYAVTLSFDIEKMRATSKLGYLTKIEEIEIAKRCFKLFRHYLDRELLGNAATRYKRELSYIPVIEGQAMDSHVHYHCLIITPPHVDLSEICISIRRSWSRTDFGGAHVDVQDFRDTGWLHYMTKEVWTIKQDSLDVDNARVGNLPKRR